MSLPMADQPDAFDLRRFAPPTGVNVHFRQGGTFRFPGDPDVDDVAILLRLEAEIQERAGADLADVLVEGKETLKRLALEADPTQDVAGLKIGPEEMLVVFTLICHGSTVAEMVARAITGANTAAGESLDANALPDEALAVQDAAVEGGDPGPLSPSLASSSDRSSGSDVAVDSLQATG